MPRRIPLLLCTLLVGCATGSQEPDAGPVIVPDAEVPDADTCSAIPEVCDGDDDNCDDVVDDGCACSPNGSTQPCFSGDPALIGHGVCVQGTQTCVDGAWSATCAGEVTSTAETCDGDDNDCDDTPDDGNPEGGACPTGMTGVCSAGTRTCSSGTLSGCVQNVQPGLEVCNTLDDDCNAGTADGSAEVWFNQACDGGDVDSCNEGVLACNGTTQACSDATGDSNRVNDGGYEGGIGAGTWVESSTVFGTPLCNVAGCGVGGGTGPRTGTFWNWLGGTDAAETAETSQAMVIPVGTTTLTFFLEIPACTTGEVETFQVLIDSTQVFSATNSDAACNLDGYVLKTVNVTSFANGASHNLRFRGTFPAGPITNPPSVTNFFVDDVRLVSCP